MKYIFIIVFGLFLLTGCGIKQEENPTIFRGKVVYADDGSPVVGGRISTVSNRRSGSPTPLPGPSKNLNLGEEATFEFEFPYQSNLEGFALLIGLSLPDKPYFQPIENIDCSPYNCVSFKPGETYNDIVVKVERP